MGNAVASVLVVDDNPDFLDVVRAILEDGSPAFCVHAVKTGAGALAFLSRERPPAFIVLDFHLEDMDAPVVLRRIAAMETARGIPVLVVSVSGWEEDEAAVRAAGAREFSVKPSRAKELRDALVAFWETHVERTPPASRSPVPAD